MVRAKFYVVSVTPQSAPEGAKEIHLTAVNPNNPNHENTAFWTATPSGELRMLITNPPAADYFKVGEEYYLDFSPAPATRY